jgi:hypothetical protein
MGWTRPPEANTGYRIHGLTVRSALPLPGLPLADADRAEIVVSFGPTPNFVAEAVPWSPDCRYSLTTSRLWFQVDGVARYLVPDKHQIIITPEPGADPGLIRQYLFFPVFYAPLYFRGLIPLHASAVSVDGGAVLFLGPQGAGKSTMAVSLRQRGYRILADDFCVTAMDENAGIVVLPGHPQLKLRMDIIQELQEDLNAWEPFDPQENKYRLTLGSDYCPTARPVTHIYLLKPANGPNLWLTPLSGASKLHPLMENNHFALGIDLTRVIDQYSMHYFRHLSALARQARVVEISYPRRLGLFQELADMVATDLHFSPITE